MRGVRRTLEQLYDKKIPCASSKYDPPYSIGEVIEKYGCSIYDRLSKDPAHVFRMETGIELVHREPTTEELVRICSNWQAMTDEMKIKSEQMSNKLFGMNNLEHFVRLINDRLRWE